MNATDLKQQLTACIRDTLRQQAYAPPRNRDTSITDPFFSNAACVVMDRLRADGWAVLPPRTVWRDVGQGRDLGVSKKTPADAEESLCLCIQIALMLYRPKWPRGRDAAALDRYYGDVAAEVVGKILISNWEVVRTLQQIAPAPLHSTPRH